MKNKFKAQLTQNHVTDTNTDDDNFPEVLLSDKRCHDNTVRVQIGNIRLVALLDSGATVSCISTALLNKLQPKRLQYLQSDICKVYGVGDIIQDISTKVQFDFHIGQQKFRNAFYALQNQYPLILGMDFLVKNKGILDFENSTITLNSEIYDLIPPPRRSTLVKTKQAHIIDAYTSTDIPVILTRPVETSCMLVEPISSLTRYAPGLDVPLAIVSSETTTCRLTIPTDTPISIPAGRVVAIARTIVLSNVTEMIDFMEHDLDKESQVNSLAQAHVESTNAYDFNEITPFPEPKPSDTSSDTDDEIPQINTSNSKLTAEEVAELIAFLLKNKNVFASTLDKLGHSTEFYHTIETGQAKPIALRFYRTSPKIQQQIDNQIEDLLRHGIIQPSTSAWASPVVMVKKTDGSYRLAIDYRALNKCSEPRNYPAPRLSDIFDQIGEAKPQYFSTLDMQGWLFC